MGNCGCSSSGNRTGTKQITKRKVVGTVPKKPATRREIKRPAR